MSKQQTEIKSPSVWRSIRNFLLTIILLIALGVGAIAGAYVWAKTEMDSPGPLAQEKTVIFVRGMRFAQISEALEKEGVIRYPYVFKAYALATDSYRKFKAGEYLFPAGVSPKAVMEMITKGDVVVHKITVPEGLTTAQILQLVRNEEQLEGNVPENMGEGLLLPETYHFTRGDSRDELVRRMRKNMRDVLETAWDNRNPDTQLGSAQEALILASIVEKETGLAEERPRVAAVFLNRLKIGMPLQSDPTVIYAIEREKGPLGRALLRKDLEFASPYNTYVSGGLPPGPIANPGKASIEAVLNPPSTNELYFVADGTGGHAFAATLNEHNNNVNKWRAHQRQKAAQQ